MTNAHGDLQVSSALIGVLYRSLSVSPSIPQDFVVSSVER